MFEQGDADFLFASLDEAFELEVDRFQGMGAAPAPPAGLPYPPRPIQDRERGGLDGTSCRSCHFSGGPDGSGSGTSLALFRGDGERLSKSTPRDAPHLMGIGYVALLAVQMSEDLNQIKEFALQGAVRVNGPYRQELLSKGVKFGWITAYPTGQVSYEEVEGVSSDLIVRPFGWKGRHHSLVELVDEALQLHHGLQTNSRLSRYQDRPALYLGDGTSSDRDQDGVSVELYSGHPAALATYLTLLSQPIYSPPRGASMLFDWSEGRRWFEETGCTECHHPALRVKKEPLTIQALGRYPVTLEINPFTQGQEPRARRVDYSSTPEGDIVSGIPIFLFSDLKRHAMGPELSEPVSEVLEGVAPISGDVWLTRPLWGLADSAPYLHDGSAQTIEEAILRHGGEAMTSRRLYEALTEHERGQLRLFLMSLGRPSTLLVE